MNLPFSPTFFRKIDIFQQLKEFEGQKDKKTLWEGVKALLVWGGSEHHQHLGSFLGPNHVKDALAYCVKENIITEEERKRLVYSCPYILESLPVYGFGDQGPSPDSKQPSVKINRNGVLAGRILAETDFLRQTWRYKIWIVIWWLILGTAAIILVSQTITSAKSIFTSVIPSQERVNTSPRIFHHRQFRINK